MNKSEGLSGRIFGITVCAAVLLSAHIGCFTADAAEKTETIAGSVYEFDEKNEYTVDSAEPSGASGEYTTLGNLSVKGNFRKVSDKDGVSAYEIADEETFTLSFEYSGDLRNAPKTEWHLTEDGKKTVNGRKLEDDIKMGAVIFQTSLDNVKWTDCLTVSDVSSSISLSEDNRVNSVQLQNGCYYRVIAAYKLEKDSESKKWGFLPQSEKKKRAEVYEFYASYKNTSRAVTGEKFYFQAGAKDAAYTVRTKNMTFTGNETIDKKDPHYGWNLGSFCLSGYTDKGDKKDVYLKKVGNQVRLSFRLNHDITQLNGDSDLQIASLKNGSDEAFRIPAHNMGRGELIIRHTDSENQTKEVKYSNFLEALASPGADTTVQLFEEGDYEVHLNYAINEKGPSKTRYYQTSFQFKIRNANTMVYIFDSATGAELGNGSVTENGFRIDSAKSSYPKLQVRKEVLNDTRSGLIEDTRFNGAASDGETFTDEGIYTVKAFNRYDDKLEPSVKTIYVGSDNLLKAYTKHLQTEDKYTVAQLKEMVESGYTIDRNGNISPPETTTTTTETTTTTLTETTTTDTTEQTTSTFRDTTSSTEVTTLRETTTAESAEENSSGNSSLVWIIVIICVIAVAGVAAGLYVWKNQQNGNDKKGSDGHDS